MDGTVFTRSLTMQGLAMRYNGGMPTRAIMIQGTGSGVGKSWLATGLCRLYARRGIRVAPFKAQNMANNAAVVAGGEIGRAQAVQAAAAGIVATVDMNPLLVKPITHTGAQLVVLGKSVGIQDARDYSRDNSALWNIVTAAYTRLAAEYDLIVIEGAGSPAEFNLRDRDLVNMRMAAYADAPVLIAGDIDKGGVFASFLGTWHLCTPDERERIAGWVINRFRGDERYLEPAPTDFGRMTGIPVRGVIPMRRDIVIDREDDPSDVRGGSGLIDIAVLRFATVSNFTDMELLAAMPGVGFRWVHRHEDLGNPDLLVLPGSKDTLGDLRRLRAAGLDRGVEAAAARHIPILGLCGGYQMLGRRIHDETGHGGTAAVEAGLGLLPVDTVFVGVKRTAARSGQTRAGWLLPAGLPVSGYEIHQGRTVASESPLIDLSSGADDAAGPDGAIAGNIAGTYLHGLLDSAAVRTALVNALRARKGFDALDMPLEDADAFRARNVDALADLLEERLDLSGL